ncbi:unnamed protein product, partial [Clonostachys rhizophaga]
MSDMLEAPPGTFSHTGGHSTDVFLTAILLPIFSIPIVVVRLWTSKFIVRRWHPDDKARLGAGDHLFNFSPSNLELLLNVGRWVGVPLYNLTTVFIKASILMFYQRFTANRALKITTYAVLAVVVAYSLVNIIASFALDCSDPEKCDRLFVAYIVCAALNVATDVAILLLPSTLCKCKKGGGNSDDDDDDDDDCSPAGTLTAPSILAGLVVLVSYSFYKN